jgi:hypothetical protein
MVATTSPNSVKSWALDLTTSYPRSPRALLGGYVLAARMLDKCRAVLNGSQGDYEFDCGLDRHFLGFSGINAEEFKTFVATGANDEAVAQWIREHAKQKDRQEVVLWNNQWRAKTMADMPGPTQAFMETYVQENLPENSVIRYFFDIFDIEEKRISPL